MKYNYDSFLELPIKLPRQYLDTNRGRARFEGILRIIFDVSQIEHLDYDEFAQSCEHEHHAASHPDVQCLHKRTCKFLYQKE